VKRVCAAAVGVKGEVVVVGIDSLRIPAAERLSGETRRGHLECAGCGAVWRDVAEASENCGPGGRD
jgi:hypothetical protein